MERFRARSKPISGSSKNNISGADRTVLARATRRVSPPDNTDGYSDNKDSSSKTEIISSRGSLLVRVFLQIRGFVIHLNAETNAHLETCTQ